MSFNIWLQNLRSALKSGRGQRQPRNSQRVATHRPHLEVLEDRLTPSFDCVGDFATGTAAPYAMVTGDFNNDGFLDVATAAETYTLLLGEGGWLGSPVPIADFPLIPPDPPTDFTSDGIADQLSISGDGGVAAVRPGRGDGTFGDPIYSTINAGIDGLVAWRTADLNGDGRLDLVLAYSTMDMGTRGSTHLGNGDGTFGNWDIFGFNLKLSVSSGSLAVGVQLNACDWLPVPPPSPPPVPSITVRDCTVTEGNTGTVAATFTVTLSAASTETVIVAYATGDGTANAGSDYQAASGTITFAPGETSKTISVRVIGDRIPEPNETFVVNVSNPTNATIADGQGAGTIVDDEPRISIGDVAKREGRNGKTTLFTFTVTLSTAYDQAVTMSFQTANGTATTSDGDYVAKFGTLTFAPGETTKTITIEVKGDSKRESDEYFYLDLFGNSSNSLFNKNRATGTILNDD
jgi:hypothetical protein